MSNTEIKNIEIEAISPVFSYETGADKFCVTKNGKSKLEEIEYRITGKGETAGTNGLVAIYVTESPEEYYGDDPHTFGRIIALVRLLPMPAIKNVNHFPSGCIDWNKYANKGEKIDRWPIGWPSEVVFYSPHGGPKLRDALLTALKQSDFGTFAHQFLQGPIDLTKLAMAPLRQRLMLEVRHQIQRDPETQIIPF